MRPFLRWAGGKRWLTHRLKHLQHMRYRKYIEPFLGSGAVFFLLEPERALLADKNPRLIETYEALQIDWESVYSLLLRHQKRHSHDYYYEQRDRYFKSQSERAAQFIYLNRTCWNGLYRENRNGQFNVPKGTKDSVLIPEDDFEAVARVLQNADIAVCDFEDPIKRARPNDLVFIDPPYTVKHNKNGFIQYNERIFRWDDQVRLASLISRKQDSGIKFIITNAYHPSVVELYKGFAQITPISRYSVLSGDSSYRSQTQEALITVGIDLDEVLCPTPLAAQ